MQNDDTPATLPYIVLVSVHGLIRGVELELGRDADTGGQTKYVVELARALSQRSEIGYVDLLTRRIEAPDIDADYARVEEPLSDKASIIRIDAGPPGYIPKEGLWDHLDSFSDNALAYFRELGHTPTLIHAHYADAGYVGTRLASHFGVALVFTGHSLGRVKRRRLLAAGLKGPDIETRYNMSRRIEAEEDTLGTADRVVASTHNEIEDQYALYDDYQPDKMRVIPPGTDLERFHPPDGTEPDSRVVTDLARFLSRRDKPMILALSRPDERKNISTLVEAYGESEALREAANLVIVAGNRDDIHEMESGAQSVLTDILLLIDQYDLYGKVAYPKHHHPDDVPVYYRVAAASGGVFVNPALTEPFGLTLIESAASELPIVATEDGGPRDIIGNCHNGYLIDPLDKEAMGGALLKVLGDSENRAALAQSGLKGVREHYSWQAHADAYVRHLLPLSQRHEPRPEAPLRRRPMLYHDRAIFTDLDQTLLGDPGSLAAFVGVMRENRRCATFGVATGRRLDSALKIMKRNHIPQPDVLITSLGTEIHYAPRLTADIAWTEHIDHSWNSTPIRRLLEDLPGIKLQPKSEQGRFKVSYYIDPNLSPSLEEIQRLMHQNEMAVNVFLSFGQFLDIVPVRASKGFALRYFADNWDIPLEHMLTAGGSGADEDMMRGNTLAVVVENRHNEELSQLADLERIYFARSRCAAGIIEAIAHYDFFKECTVPSE